MFENSLATVTSGKNEKTDTMSQKTYGTKLSSIRNRNGDQLKSRF